MLKYTKYLLQQIEEMFDELDYTIRYEKGQFQSGYCIVENRRICVINKFFDTEARINCLIEILDNIEFDPESLSENSTKTYKKLAKVLDTTDSNVS